MSRKKRNEKHGLESRTERRAEARRFVCYEILAPQKKVKNIIGRNVYK